MKKLMVMLFAAFAAIGAWAETWTDASGNVWTYSGSTVTAVSFETTNLTIPDTLGGNPVTAFNVAVFKGQTRAVRVTIPATVTAIPDRAFEGCENLKAVTIKGSGLTSIGYRAFAGCSNFASFTIPDSVTVLGKGVFSGCTSLESVTIGNGITKLTGVPYQGNTGGTSSTHYGDYGEYSGSSTLSLVNQYDDGLFYNCTSLKTINWGANVQEIGNVAFLNCSALESVAIPDTVTSLGYHAFVGCDNLVSVKIGAKVPSIGLRAFFKLPNLMTVTFGAGLTEIQTQAFEGCVNLKNFTLPAKIQYIRYRAFAGCNKALTAVTIPTNSDGQETVLGKGVFSGCTALTTVTLGGSLKTLTGVPYQGNTGGTSSTHYGDYGEYSGSSTLSLVNQYDDGLFYNCTSLKTINWGTSVQEIGNVAFLNCSALESMAIPDTVTSLGYHAFVGCDNLVSVKIGAKVPSIGLRAFFKLPNLTTVTFGAGLTEIQTQAFEGCVNLKNFTLPAKIQHIRYRAFAGCNKVLTAVTIPTNSDELETVLGKGVFSGCTALASVTFGDSVKTLTGVPYQGNTGGTSSTHYGDYGEYSGSTKLSLVNQYDDGLFYNCTSLKTINWGKGIKSIGNVAFLNCTSLTSIVLPETTDGIGNHAFCGCTSLKTVVALGQINSIGTRAFCNCTTLHYVDFRGPSMAFAPGNDLFFGDKDQLIVFAAEGSTGWTGEAGVAGLPVSGKWCGARITYAPPPEGANNPYDFYVYPSKDTISRTDYYWSLMVTTNRYVYGRTVPQSVATIREGDPVYLSYAFDEYWRGEAFDVTNRLVLSGAKSASFDFGVSAGAYSDANYWWKTNAVPEQLQNLAPGSYKLTLQLNAGNRLKETGYSNNSTSIAFTVVSVPKHRVTFNANGGSVSESSRTVYEGKAVGTLPVPTKSGSMFVGWYVGDTLISETTPVLADMTCTAKWQSFDIIFWKPLDMSWRETMFVSSSSYANEMQTTFSVGDPIYFYYACYEKDAQTVRTAFVNRFSLTGDNGVSKGLYHNISGISSGTCEGVYGRKVDALQGLAAGTYTFTCTLDADRNVVESNEGNNTKTITFTIVPAGTTLCTVTFNANGGSGGTTRSVASGSAVGTLPTTTRSGYTFIGWFTAASGGTQISASTKVTANVTYYAHWTASGVYPSGSRMPITIDQGNGRTATSTAVVGQTWGSSLPAAPAAPSGQTFVGWYTGRNGTGTRVTATSIVPNTPVTLYPYFVAKETHWLYDSVVGAVLSTAASEYNGYLYDAKGSVKGTIQVKVGKADRKIGAAAVKATVVGLDGKKVLLKAEGNGKAVIATSGPTTVSLVGGESCAVKLGAEGLYGKYGSYFIDGARNFFTSKDKTEQAAANAILEKWLGSVNVMWNGGSVNVVLAKKGKVKVKGTLADGKTKISANTVFLIGEQWCCVPVVAPKASLAFVVWLSLDGRKAAVEGLGSGTLVGRPGTLAANAKFRVAKDAALWAQIPGTVLTKYLPDGVAVAQSGTKWTLPKAGKIAYLRGTTEVDETKLGENPSELKLTYKAKDGSFKGSFKVYADNGGKLKATTVNVTGVVIGGVGYGAATVKGVGSVSVRVE